ncbi:uncharacterized protein H6S33_004371 [Morchella sextelata]|uniref:uncharacterized protein n=1 Tax=Morchella sextelata TaxID=1174677 RepID=UPI001D03C2E4|nr:uncharacterized protein H6S33_004371 [Morchella sextelata]KAH0605914.1 hypothetical protein H6S33_004371 [Morchella sextelata]
MSRLRISTSVCKILGFAHFYFISRSGESSSITLIVSAKSGATLRDRGSRFLNGDHQMASEESTRDPPTKETVPSMHRKSSGTYESTYF